MTTYGAQGGPRLFGTAWSWWTRPRAVCHAGIVYVGSVTRTGHVVVEEWPSSTTVRARHLISRLSGEQDDHNNPAIILEVGKKPIVFYARHGRDQYLRYRRGTANYSSGADLGSFNPETLIDFGSLVTYVEAWVDGNDHLHVLTRTSSTRSWSYIKSTDWGDTWSTPVALMLYTTQCYMATALVGTTLRCASSSHPKNDDNPDQDIHYFEIDLTSGDITTGGSVVANTDGTNLPIAQASLATAAAPTTDYRTWVYDVGLGTTPEITWGSYDPADLAGTSMYHYSVLVDDAWVTNDIVAAGGTFEGTTEPYLGGCQLESDGVVIVSRESGDDWFVERHTTANNGTSWSVEAVVSETRNTRSAVRAFPVEVRDATPAPFEVAVNWANDFNTFRVWKGNVGGSAL